MEHARAMDVIEFKTLHQRAVDERRVGGRQTPVGAPHSADLALVEPAERRHQDPTPRQFGAVERATKRIEDQQLDARNDLGGNALEGEAGDEGRNALGIGIVDASAATHTEYCRSRARYPTVSTTASRSRNEAISSIMAAALPSRAIVANTRCIALMAARWV